MRALTVRRILSAAVLLVLLLGCGRGARKDGASLTFLMPPDEVGYWRRIADEFEARNPDLQIEIIEGPKSAFARETIYTTSLLSEDDTFDLLYLDVIWTPKFAAAGWVEDITDLLEEEDWSDFLKGVIEASRYRGRIYRLPIRADAGVLYYRKDLLEQAGLQPPQTFKELIDIAKQLQRPPDLWGYVWQGKQYEGLVCNYVEVLAGMGGYWVEPNTGNVGLDSSEAEEALRFLRDAVAVYGISPPGVGSYEEEEGRRIFQQGGAVFHRNWPYAWRTFQAADSPVKDRVGVLPMVHGEGKESAAALGGWGLAMSKFSGNKEAAKRFLKFAASFETQKKFVLNSGYVPARRSVFQDKEVLAAFPFFEQLYPAARQSVPRPAVPQYAAVSDILQRYASAAISDRLSSKEALKRAAEETRRVLR